MTTLTRRALSLSAGAAIAVGTLATAVPSASAMIDPSAYGVWAIGASTNLAATPAVDWTSGAGLQASSTGAHAAGLSAGAAYVAAGNGYAEAVQTDLHYGAIDIRAVIATCRDGHTSVRIYGTDGSAALASGHTAQFGGLDVRVGAVTHFSDGSTSVAGATITGPGEQITVAVARCGAAS